jgi:hypothetical protein
MRWFQADPTPSYTTRIHPALTGFADEVCSTAARLIAYVVALALLATLGIALWNRLPDTTATEPAAKGEWSAASRSVRAFAVSQSDSRNKTEIYEMFRHPQGGRKDVFRWTAADQKGVAELEIYRPGAEVNRAGPAIAGIAVRMDPVGARELEAFGVIDSKFGTVTLLRLIGAEAGRSCLGLLKRIVEPDFQISGWSCQGDTLPARRAAIRCMLNRLILLTAGNDLKLAELFAHAELKRPDCASPSAPALSADWVTGNESPRLRGAL